MRDRADRLTLGLPRFHTIVLLNRSRMRWLESLEFLQAAHALYRSVGFRRIDPYEQHSMESYQSRQQLENFNRITLFMEMEL